MSGSSLVQEVQQVERTGGSQPSQGTATAPTPGAAATRAQGSTSAPSSSSSGSPSSSSPDSYQASAEEDGGRSPISFDWGLPSEAAEDPAARQAGQADGQAEEATAEQEVKPTDFGEEHRALDKDKDGKVTAKDLGLSEKDFARKDANKDGKLSKDEYRADFHRQNSFQTLDADKDGKLSTEEMGRLARFGSADYDANHDGSVDAEEFKAARGAEMRAARREHLQQKLDSLAGDDLDKMVKKFDGDGDGKLTVNEVLEGRREGREKWRNDLSDKAFTALAGDGKTVSVADNKRFGAYDADGDGQVTHDEFLAGQKADWQALREDLYLDGALNPEERKRLGVDAAGKPLPGASSKPVDVGNLQNLTWESATALIRQQGGKLFENGQPTVLAVRTENAGTTQYEDAFVVLKPNGEMKTFAASTRPGFTTPSGGWNPEMVVPGNYSLTPRWRDGKYNNDAFIVGNTSGGMTVRTAADSNGDGVYSQSEIANTHTSSEIRLHRGNANSTSSAGCFNVQDYDAFLAYLGGRDVSFNLTLVEA